MFAMFFTVVFAVFVCHPAAFCQLCFYNKDWIGLDWIGSVIVMYTDKLYYTNIIDSSPLIALPQ